MVWTLCGTRMHARTQSACLLPACCMVGRSIQQETAVSGGRQEGQTRVGRSEQKAAANIAKGTQQQTVNSRCHVSGTMERGERHQYLIAHK